MLAVPVGPLRTRSLRFLFVLRDKCRRWAQHHDLMVIEIYR
jgi:hypothetical protein